MTNIISLENIRTQKQKTKIEQEDMEIAQDIMNMMRDERNLTENVEYIQDGLGVTNQGNVVFCHSDDVDYENVLRMQLNKKYKYHLNLVK